MQVHLQTHGHSFLQTDGAKRNKATRRLEIPIRENIYGGMTMEELYEAHKKELQLAQQDQTMGETKNKEELFGVLCL